MFIVRFFRRQGLSESVTKKIAVKIEAILGFAVTITTEHGFYVGLSEKINAQKYQKIRELLWTTYDPTGFGGETYLGNPTVIEIGPNMNFQTPWSSRAVNICKQIGLEEVKRIERTTRYGFDKKLTEEQIAKIMPLLFNKMKEEPYDKPLESFTPPVIPKKLGTIPLISEGIQALDKFNKALGLGMDEFIQKRIHERYQAYGRDATDVEIFQWGQGDSNHCRHWDYTAIFYIDGVRSPKTLMQRIKGPYLRHPGNATGAFDDNDSAIRGYTVPVFIPLDPTKPTLGHFVEFDYDIIISAETHNHPTMWEAFEGSATGLGGIIRDEECERNGAIYVDSSVGFCTSNLCIPGDIQPWELTEWERLPVRQHPMDLLLAAMAGGYGYGNCFGIPVTSGFLRTFGMDLPDEFDERVEWDKPIVYVAISGKIPHENMREQKVQPGDYLVYFGGPAYRVGIGGGSASSQDAGSISEELDFNSVQRGDPAEENPVDRVVQTCVNMGPKNPTIKKHDSGAGGSANNLTEASYPEGADVDYDLLPMGDDTLTPMEGWGNESQEHNVAVVRGDENLKVFLDICKREGCFAAAVGRITGTKRFVLRSSRTGETYVDLPMEDILGDRPPKEFHFERLPITRYPLAIPEGLTIRKALDMVLRLPSAGSKEAQVTFVDGTVGGNVAQGQRVGPMQLPVSDYSALTLSRFSREGFARSLGERPLSGLNSAQAQIRITFSEALLNLAGIGFSRIADIKCQSNFMTAVHFPNQGAWIDDAVTALEAFVDELEACEPTGGKDSSNMASKMLSPIKVVKKVRAPSQFVVSTQVTVPDVSCRVTPYMEIGDNLLWIDLSPGHKPLGGSALSQVLGQTGNDYPDIAAKRLHRGLTALQEMVHEGYVSAMHDISDDGLILAMLEMAFCSNAGLSINIHSKHTDLETLFSGAPGVVIAYRNEDRQKVFDTLDKNFVAYQVIGKATANQNIHVVFNDKDALIAGMIELREIWRETSYKLDEQQSNLESIAEEREIMRTLAKSPMVNLTFVPQKTPNSALKQPTMAVLRAQCTNGDRELADMFQMAGWNVYPDVNMNDLLERRFSIKDLDLIAFAGGFADGDVPATAVGWAKLIQDNPILADQFAQFIARENSLVFGVCNGFQVLARLGWLPGYELPLEKQPILVQNKSERFQSRFVSLKFEACESPFTRGMAGSIFPQVPIAHGEGRLFFPDPAVLERIEKDLLVALRFVDFDGKPSDLNPFSNGSPNSITGLCSANRRILGVMPHFERIPDLTQLPWLPKAWKYLEGNPFLKMFQNAREWIQDRK